MNILWDAPQPGRERPVLSVPVIAQAATAIADAEGLEAVSMQRVAAALGFTKMSLYRYVASKNELLAVMIDTAVGPPPGLVRGDWRAKVEALIDGLVETWARHPWLPWATVGERVMGPNEVGWTEGAVRAFEDTGLSGAARMDAVVLVFGHLRNTHRTASTGTQIWAADHRVTPTYAGLMAQYGDRYPALTAALADAGDAPADYGRRFGLDCILDGLAARMDAS